MFIEIMRVELMINPMMKSILSKLIFDFMLLLDLIL
jgi:hypothetical protein